MSEPLTTERRTARGHMHAEAFCLMQYACKVCRHFEVIWNSRDGVTPFCTACPSCGQPHLYHVNFMMDRYTPDHKPHRGQRVWTSMTRERAYELAKRNISTRRKPGPETDMVIDSVANSYYQDGAGPDIRIEGYAEVV